jgi:hypothetical protein
VPIPSQAFIVLKQFSQEEKITKASSSDGIANTQKEAFLFRIVFYLSYFKMFFCTAKNAV